MRQPRPSLGFENRTGAVNVSPFSIGADALIEVWIYEMVMVVVATPITSPRIQCRNSTVTG